MENTKKKSKLILLRIELKNEIIEFLPIIQAFNNCICLNKSFLSILRRTGIFRTIKNNLNNFLINLLNISYLATKNQKENIKKIFLTNLSKKQINSLLTYLIALKIRKNKILKISHSYDNSQLKTINLFWKTLKSNNANKKVVYGKYSAKLIFPVIALKANLIEINFLDNKLGEGDKVFENLCEAIFQNKNLKKIYLTNNLIGSSSYHLKHLKEALKENKELEFLNLEKNCISQTNINDALYISDIIKQNKKLNDLNLNCNYIGTYLDDVKYVFEAFYCNDNLVEVNLSRNNIGLYKQDCDYIKNNMLKTKQNMKLYLFKNHMKDEDFESMVKCIKTNKPRLDIV